MPTGDIPSGVGSALAAERTMRGSTMRGPTLEEERERLTPLIKQLRQDIDALIQKTTGGASQTEVTCRVFAPEVNEAQAQVRINLTNAKMWAGKMLEFLGSPFPKELADKATIK